MRFVVNVQGRLLGVDYGQKRIGLAISDHTGLIASPIDAINAKGTADADTVACIAVENDAVAIVVGLPLSLDGSYGPAARKVNAFCRQLRLSTDIPVYVWDERMTTIEAQSILRESGNKPTWARGTARGRIDSASAAIILNAYLQSNQYSNGTNE